MLEIVKKFLIKYNINGKRLMVAFSGGYDSTVLLNIMKELRNLIDFELFAIHLNHNWRGEESDREEETCRKFCEENNINFFSKKLPLNSTKNELEAREERYKFFREIYEQENIDYILTAHTKSDNAETLVYRLAKGTGINGLKGISEYAEMSGMKILRPLISISREEIENYINKNNLNANFDSSNKNKKYLRNKVRLDIIPKFKEIAPTYEDNILNTSKIAKFYDEALNYYIQRDDIFENDVLKTQKFLKLPYELQNIVLYKFLNKQNEEINFKQIQLLLKEIKTNIPNSGKYFSLSSSKFVLIKTDKIEFTEKIEKNINDYQIFITTTNEKIDKFPNGTQNYIYADKTVIKKPLILRKRQDGDVFQPFGMHGKMKLKKFLNMKAIPKFERDNLFLITNSSNEILWIYPVATSETIRIKNEQCVKIEIRERKK